MSPFDGLAVVRRNEHPDSGSIDELISNPAWYMDLSDLNRYYRLNQWADSRWNRMNEFDSDADDARDSLLSLSSTEIDIEEVLPVSEEIQSLQIEFTEYQTRFDAEFQSFEENFKKRTDEGTDVFGNPLDVALPRPDEPDVVDRSEDRTNSVVEYFEDASEQTLEQMNDRHTQIREKIESLVSSVDSRTRVTATDENLKLQKKGEKAHSCPYCADGDSGNTNICSGRHRNRYRLTSVLGIIEYQILKTHSGFLSYYLAFIIRI